MHLCGAWRRLLLLLLAAQRLHALLQAIAAGWGHTCALSSSGVKCWGYNDVGQLGQGDEQTRGDGPYEMGGNLSAIDLGTNLTVQAIAAGSAHSCAVFVDGSIKCWGNNPNGRLGQGTSNLEIGDEPGEMGTNLSWTNVGGPVAAISAGDAFSCALLQSGAVKCWGANGVGQLGLDDTEDRGTDPGDMGSNLPAVELGRNATAISAGFDHACALLDDGGVKCWGSNAFGQLGQGTTGNLGDEEGEVKNLPPINLGTNRTAVAITAGTRHTCAILDDGDVKCWGSNNYGQLGNGDKTGRGKSPSDMGDHLPTVNLGTGRTAVAITAGQDFTCAILDTSQVKCWGNGEEGQLGSESTDAVGTSTSTMGDNLQAVNLGDGRTAVMITAGAQHTIALLDDGSIKCWGVNFYGQLGYGDTEDRGDESNEMGDNLKAIDLKDDTIFFCSVGFFGQEDCEACPAGTWALADATQFSECIGCKPGDSSAPASTQCSVCPPGTFANSTASPECTPCGAGRYSNETGATSEDVCIACPAGSYSTVEIATSNETCTLCPAGTYSPDEGASSNSSCIPCAAGRYSTDEGAFSISTCDPCTPGRYSTVEGAPSNGTCSLCPAGTYSSAEAASSAAMCILCPAGKYSYEQGATTDATCVTCGAGRYSTEEGAATNETCTACRPGTYSGEEGASSNDTCALCPAGTYSTDEAAISNSTCTPCAAGRFSTEEGAAANETCTACQPGTYSGEEGASSNATCILCPAGTYSTDEAAISNSTCIPCGAGRYSTEEGAATNETCTACQPGTYSGEEGAFSEETCILCPAGTYSTDEAAISNSTCIPCGAGRYSTEDGADECTPCDLGTYSNVTGASSIDTCKPCDAGSYADEPGSESCSLCPEGTYSDAAGATNDTACRPCDVGTYQLYRGANSSQDCIPCIAGTYSNVTAATSEDTCTQCPLGRYNPQPGAPDLGECVVCEAGKYGDEPGLDACKLCVAGTYSSAEGATSNETCIECPAGTYSTDEAATSNSTCLPCGRGRYNPEPGASKEQQCFVCQAGKYGAQDVLAECTPCVAGRYSADEGAESESTCQHCAAGKYSEAEGATNETTCMSCDAGKYSTVEGASSETTCTACALGKYSTVPAADSEPLCTPCLAGKYSTTPAASSEAVCIACEAGRFSDVLGASTPTTCQACAPGKYSTEEAADSESACIECPAGTYSTAEGADSEDTCTACAAGRFSDVSRASTPDTCEPCQTGRYSADEGATTCEFCESGTFAGAQAQFECTGCGNGRYAKTGWSQCEVCPEGTYSAKTDCIDCPSGLASPAGSDSSDECQSVTSSFVTGAAILAGAIALVLVYIVSGRAFTIAHREKESAISSVVRMCGTISSTLLSGLEWQQESAFFWKMLAVVLLTVVLYVATLLLFLTNVFFLSRSFLVAPGWVDQFQAGIESLMQRIPVLAFLYIVPPIAKFFQFIDFTDLFVGVRVSCMGAQAPLVLAMNAIILIGTVVIIDSQLHTVLTLALVPMLALMRDRLLSASNVGLLTRARNIVRFAVLVVVSSTMTSLSRYVMQAFATVINYADFFPYHDWSQACNDDKADEALAYLTTVAAYGAAIPALLMIILVAMPGAPRGVKDQSRSAGTRPQVDSKAAATTRPQLEPKAVDATESKTRWARVLSLFNPVAWLLACMRLTLNRMHVNLSDEIVTTRRSFAIHDELQDVCGPASAVSTTQADVPGVGDLRASVRSGDWRQLGATLWTMLAIYAWKVKLALLLVFGVWTDELVETMQVDATARQHFDWVADPSRLHEDVMSVVGPMRSMVWMLAPVTIIFAKLSEVTNNPPVFVRSGKVTLLSPWLFRSWAEAEAVMLEGRELLKRLCADHTAAATPASAAGVVDWRARLQHNVQVALVWVLGARLPRFLINLSIFVLAVAEALNPTSDTLLVAAVLLFPWVLLQALAVVTDVTLMLRLRKLLLCDGSGASNVPVVEVEMRTMPGLVDASDLSAQGDV